MQGSLLAQLLAELRGVGGEDWAAAPWWESY